MAVVTDNPPQEYPIVDAEGRSTELMFVWMALLANLLRAGFSGTITTAAITGGGTTGSMTFQNGVLIEEVSAT